MRQVRTFLVDSARGIESVGLHLCGPLSEGLGKWGLGSEYVPGPSADARAVRLGLALQAATGLPVLIENANFYDADAALTFRAIESASDIARRADAGLILDLSHLAMVARNSRLAPQLLMGRVDLSRVSVVHVSGIVEGPNGVWHDGHTEAVHGVAWELLECLLGAVTESFTVVLEHTDYVWRQKSLVYCADVARLQRVLERTPAEPPVIDIDRVALSYIANLVMPSYFRELVDILGERAFREAVLSWGHAFQEKRENRWVSFSPWLRAPDVGGFPGEALDPRHDFLQWLRGRIDFEPTRAP